MTANNQSSAVHVPGSPARRQAVRPVTFPRVMRAEWIKFTTLRSTLWIVALTIAIMVGMTALMAWGISQGAPMDDGGAAAGQEGQDVASPDGAGLAAVTFSYTVGQIVVAVLGVLIATSEYATGQIRSTLAAVPKRWPVLVAKALVGAISAFLLGAVAVALCVLVTNAIFSGTALELDLSADGAMRSVIGVPLYLMAIALFGLAVGFLLRHTAGAISLVLGVLLVLPVIVLIPMEWVQELALYLPDAAGSRLIEGDVPGAELTPWAGFAVLGGYVVVLLTLAGVLLRRRDA